MRGGTDAELVLAMLAARSRGEIRRWGEFLDGDGRRLRGALVAEALRRGATPGADWDAAAGKALLRRCLDREGPARARLNPIHRDEGFVCAHCGADVPPGGRRPRDHCPRCLHSLHVDVVPGDRAEACGGLLVPRSVMRSRDHWIVQYRCASCGASRTNRVLDDVAVPDDAERLRALVVRGARGD